MEHPTSSSPAYPVAVAAGPPPDRREPGRVGNLDVLRASAIVLVVIYHVVVMGPFELPWLKTITSQGRYGVDLFFVLSGWLIGGLYWRECARFGRVRLGRFLLRRWIRTIPPYLVALALSWAAARVARAEPFDFGYLIFIQNYYAKIPFFLVSWSLCIEEHFYVLVPFGLWLVGQRRLLRHVFFVALLAVPPLCRLLAARNGIPGDFGYGETATHFRLEGLVLGFWLSYLPQFAPPLWEKFTSLARLLFVPALTFLVAMPFLSPSAMYIAGLSGLAVALTVILVASVHHRPLWIARLRWVEGIALASYSVYLTHALMIHVARKIMACASWLPPAGYYPLAFLLAALAGWAFYFLIERTSIILRDRWVPRRVA